MEEAEIPHSLSVCEEAVDKPQTNATANFPSSEARVDACDGEVHITGVDIHHFKYNPVDTEWRQRACLALELQYCGPNGITPGRPNISLTPPVTFRRILGDGNCLFRALSFIITGSEEQHMLVRQAIVAHMRSLGQVLWEHHIYPDVAYRNGMEHYLSETCMERSGAWGTQVEIIALANLLNIPIYTVSVGEVWTAGCLWLPWSESAQCG